MNKEERLKRVGQKVFTVVSYEKGVLKTCGEAVYEGESIPPPGLVKIKGVDANELGFKSPKLKFSDKTVLYGTIIHYNFIDTTIKVSSGIYKDRDVNLWQYMKSSAKEIIEVKPSEFLEDYKKSHS